MLATFWCGPLIAQMSVTGSVSGTVLDSSGAVIPGATVKLTSAATGDTRQTKTNGEGLSLLPPCPGIVHHEGGALRIQEFERTGMVVTANEHVSLSGSRAASRTSRRP